MNDYPFPIPTVRAMDLQPDDTYLLWVDCVLMPGRYADCYAAQDAANLLNAETLERLHQATLARGDAAITHVDVLRAALAVERERCAQLCEHEAAMWRGQQDISDFKLCAAVIRRADSEHSARVLLPPIGSGTQAALQVADERRGLSDERVLMIGRRAVDKCPSAEAQHLYIAREVERAHGIAR